MIADAEETARLKMIADAEETARLKMIANAEEVVRLKAVVEETAQQEPVVDTEESMRKKTIADIEEAVRQKAVESVRGFCVDCAKMLEEQGSPRDTSVCEQAAERGHLDCLIWARDHKCPWQPSRCKKLAQDKDHYHIVKWIASQSK